jgi:hypothetical protein
VGLDHGWWKVAVRPTAGGVGVLLKEEVD